MTTRIEAPIGRIAVYNKGRDARDKGLERQANPWVGHPIYQAAWDTGWENSDEMLRRAALPIRPHKRGRAA